MADTCLLSLVTITRNDPAGLERTLASTAAWLEDPAVEQVVVEASAPPTAVARPAVRIIRQQEPGIASAFNEGLAAARGEWLWFLNGGDQVDPRLGPAFLLALLRASRADVIIGATTYERETDARAHVPPNRRWPPVQPWIPHPSTLIRHRLFAELGGFDPAYTIAMDYEWWMRAVSADVPIDVISVPLAVFASEGISQRPESRDRLIREKGDVIRRHQRDLWCAWILTGGRLLRGWLRALVARRIARKGKPAVKSRAP